MTEKHGQRALWAGVAIASMWLAVLFVGLWGGDIVSGANASTGQAGSTVPTVVVVAPCALIATVVIARRAFGDDDDRRS
jgi:hypothetical protein